MFLFLDRIDTTTKTIFGITAASLTYYRFGVTFKLNSVYYKQYVYCFLKYSSVRFIYKENTFRKRRPKQCKRGLVIHVLVGSSQSFFYFHER